MATHHKRVGFYCWAGPGTIRMLRVKFFSPKIDRKSLLGSYDEPLLRNIRETFGVTDFWATYSWGFADTVEAPDRAFILSRLPGFKKLGIRVHAYIQGPNVVWSDFQGQDWFCRDERDDLIPYSRGRKVVCVNNPGFRRHIAEKVAEACTHDFDGIFIDNIQMGKLGMPGGEKHSSVFVGCACWHCREKFRSRYGYELPKILKPGSKERQQYLRFRSDSVLEFLLPLSAIARANGKEFGTNSYDPRFDPFYCYGTNLRELTHIQDYLLFENHSFPDRRGRRNNQYIDRFVEEHSIEKPVFVVSYKHGIGFEKAFTQRDIDTLFSEASRSNFHICLKGSEYRTKKVWHNLDPSGYHKPSILPYAFPIVRKRRRRSVFTYPGLDYLLRVWSNRIFAAYMESRMFQLLLSPFYRALLRKK